MTIEIGTFLKKQEAMADLERKKIEQRIKLYGAWKSLIVDFGQKEEGEYGVGSGIPGVIGIHVEKGICWKIPPIEMEEGTVSIYTAMESIRERKLAKELADDPIGISEERKFDPGTFTVDNIEIFVETTTLRTSRTVVIIQSGLRLGDKERGGSTGEVSQYIDLALWVRKILEQEKGR